MCGIFAVVRSGSRAAAPTAPVVSATRIIRHRGRDDEGYLLWDAGELRATVFAGSETAEETRAALRLPMLPPSGDWRVALGHRRLSIVDLSPAGHQPMLHRETGLSVVYNGEIYNHVELRDELVSLGHRFESHCDTEVLLAAWAEWGPDALHRFNGMFSFVVLDPRNGGTVHAVRDRFGIKPLYWCRVGNWLAFASEQKQLRTLPGFLSRINERTVRDYLVAGQLDYSSHTFDQQIAQILGGERAVVDLREPSEVPVIIRWYDLEPRRFTGTLKQGAKEVRDLLTDSVALRLRADVPVGSCLSGGLDSSAIVTLASRALEGTEHAGQATVTARFEDPKFDEWGFASQVIAATGAQSLEVWPTVERLQSELDAQLWFMDEPFGSTSQFSQWCVFGAAAEAGLTVMLDGQGSDEQLAGYSGNDAALYAGLLRRGRLLDLADEVRSFRHRHGVAPLAQMVFAVRNVLPFTDRFLPGHVRQAPAAPDWLARDPGTHTWITPPRDLNDSLRRQTLSTSLPVLLRYEDRNSMARSIEARVPFLDYRLVELLAGMPDTYKLRRGVTKLVFRESMRGVLPETVRDRRDKMGFVTPEEVWLTRSARAWFRDAVGAATEAAPDYFDADRVLGLVDAMAEGRMAFSFLPWRILCFGRWIEQQRNPLSSPSPFATAVRT
jgi:asparagine synthase (glutamine-hydrolysing)